MSSLPVFLLYLHWLVQVIGFGAVTGLDPGWNNTPPVVHFFTLRDHSASLSGDQGEKNIAFFGFSAVIQVEVPSPGCGAFSKLISISASFNKDDGNNSDSDDDDDNDKAATDRDKNFRFLNETDLGEYQAEQTRIDPRDAVTMGSTVPAFKPTIEIDSACLEGAESPTMSVCFLALGLGKATFNIVLNDSGRHVSGSPFNVMILPAGQASHSCVRPGAGSLTSSCRSSRDEKTSRPTISAFPPKVMTESRHSVDANRNLNENSKLDPSLSDSTVQQTARQADDSDLTEPGYLADAAWRNREMLSSLKDVDDNLYSAQNFCLHENRVVLFGGHDEVTGVVQRAVLRLSHHAWGTVVSGNMEVPIDIRDDVTMRDFAVLVNASISDGDAGAGAGPVYIFPEGPSTHFGHTLMDSVMPLFATSLYMHDHRSRMKVILWPSGFFVCPVKSTSTLSARHWNLFSATSPEPKRDIRRLPDVLASGSVCYREAYVGSLIDGRVGARGYFDPFYEELQHWVVKMRRNFGLTSILVPIHESSKLKGRLTASDSRPMMALLIQRKLRRMLNRGDIHSTLRNAGLLSRDVDWAGMPLARQMEVCAEADVVMGVHGTEVINVLFVRMGTVLIDIIPYCWDTGFDFYEMIHTQRMRNYWWRNPDPSRSSCPSGAPAGACTVPKEHCGYAPKAEQLLPIGFFGGEDIGWQDTLVDLSVVQVFAEDAVEYLRGGTVDSGSEGGLGQSSASGCHVEDGNNSAQIRGGPHKLVCDAAVAPLVCDELPVQERGAIDVLPVCRGDVSSVRRTWK